MPHAVLARWLWVSGLVQGVGFRWWTRARALELGLVGYAENLQDGRVEVFAQGPPDAVAQLEELLGEYPARVHPDNALRDHATWRPRPGDVWDVTGEDGQPELGLRGFVER